MGVSLPPQVGQPGSNHSGVVGQISMPQQGAAQPGMPQQSQQPQQVGAASGASKPSSGAQQSGVINQAPPPTAAGPGMSYGGYTPRLGMLAQQTPMSAHGTIDANAALNPYLGQIQQTVNNTKLPSFNLAAGMTPLNQTGAPVVSPAAAIVQQLQGQPQGTTDPSGIPGASGGG